MIDWVETKRNFGEIDVSVFRPKVIVRCDKCNVEATYTIRVKSKIVNNQVEWLCYKCACNKDNVKQKHSQKTKQQWENKEYRRERSTSSKRLWKNEEYKNKITIAESKFYNQIDVKERLSDYYTEKYADLTYRERQRDGSIKLWKDLEFRKRVAEGTGRSAVLNGTMPSSLHYVLVDILKGLGVKYEMEYAIGPYVFDFIIFSSKKPLVVEIHGDYWHNRSEAIERDKRKSSYIMLLSEKYDYKVIWEFEFYTKGRVNNIIKYSLGLSSPPSLVDFEFQDVEIRKIDPKQARIFFTRFHYSGSLGRGGQIFGAFLNSELIGAIIYSSVIRKEVAEKQNVKCNEITEISRFAIADNRHKRNFASWLISRTIKLGQIVKKIIAFADTTFGHDGTIYKAVGFDLDGEVAPSYWYVDNNGWVMHKKTLYEHARSIRMTESEFAMKNGYNKIYGAKKLRYVKCL